MSVFRNGNENVHTNGGYRQWRGILENWTHLVEKTYRATKGESSAYSHKERTNTGLLAAAAITNGWVALEECRSSKLNSTESDSEDLYEGRSDLKIWRDDQRNKLHYEIEAKFLRVSLSSHSKSRLEQAGERAINDALRAAPSGQHFAKRVAMTFVVPMLTENQLGNDLDKSSVSPEMSLQISEKLSSLINHIQESKPHFLAYSFPGLSKVAGRPHRRSPGIIVFGREPIL